MTRSVTLLVFGCHSAWFWVGCWYGMVAMNTHPFDSISHIINQVRESDTADIFGTLCLLFLSSFCRALCGGSTTAILYLPVCVCMCGKSSRPGKINKAKK